ncbi:uncharacterized protein MYCFIDRAFT_176049 [Pseudocercospora fijiensis CIRAD86]|uniref:Uncharacterized protein n=1 Tax=Pseudocercospora fijiensis (strain CIRAD86) TaxID=383855 RepID=M3AZ62_PSEFD|nr:uncharacterized protein MYCFIDRAFT_176049 [Pseudocercospora fijiensis CIRAD86]EME82502.1 hypothetical protein MYCFIDRAFT_176049 [Pseudocercospora fijiensis CIRAD86]
MRKNLCKEKGNAALRNGKPSTAWMCYSEGIRLLSEDFPKSNRALLDLYRNLAPNDQAIQVYLQRTDHRLREESQGFCNFAKLRKNLSLERPRVDAASFTGNRRGPQKMTYMYQICTIKIGVTEASMRSTHLIAWLRTGLFIMIRTAISKGAEELKPLAIVLTLMIGWEISREAISSSLDTCMLDEPAAAHPLTESINELWAATLENDWNSLRTILFDTLSIKRQQTFSSTSGTNLNYWRVSEATAEFRDLQPNATSRLYYNFHGFWILTSTHVRRNLALAYAEASDSACASKQCFQVTTPDILPMTFFVTLIFGRSFDVPNDKHHHYKSYCACAATLLHIELRISNRFPTARLDLGLDQSLCRYRNRVTLSLQKASKHSTSAGIPATLNTVHRTTVRKAFRSAAKSPLSSSSTSSPQLSSATMQGPFWFGQMSQSKRDDNEEDYDERVRLARWDPEQHFKWCRTELQDLIYSTPGKWKIIQPPRHNDSGKYALEEQYRDKVKDEKRRYEHLANYEKDPKTLLKEATYRSMRYRNTETKKDSKKLVERKKGWKVSLPSALKEQLSKPIPATANQPVSNAPGAGAPNAVSDNVERGSDAEEEKTDPQTDTDDTEQLGHEAKEESRVPYGKGTDMPRPNANHHDTLLPPTSKSEPPTKAALPRRPDICQHRFCKMSHLEHGSECICCSCLLSRDASSRGRWKMTTPCFFPTIEQLNGQHEKPGLDAEMEDVVVMGACPLCNFSSDLRFSIDTMLSDAKPFNVRKFCGISRTLAFCVLHHPLRSRRPMMPFGVRMMVLGVMLGLEMQHALVLCDLCICYADLPFQRGALQRLSLFAGFVLSFHDGTMCTGLCSPHLLFPLPKTTLYTNNHPKLYSEPILAKSLSASTRAPVEEQLNHELKTNDFQRRLSGSSQSAEKNILLHTGTHRTCLGRVPTFISLVLSHEDLGNCRVHPRRDVYQRDGHQQLTRRNFNRLLHFDNSKHPSKNPVLHRFSLPDISKSERSTIQTPIAFNSYLREVVSITLRTNRSPFNQPTTMANSAVHGGAPAGPAMPPWHDQIIVASCMPAALGKLSSTRDTLSELASRNVNLTDAQILTGHIHPDDICGALADDLGKRFSNAILATGLRILDYVWKSSYNASNFIVARVNAPRKLLKLPASTRPKAEPASRTPPTVTYVLMDQGQHAGQWVRIDVNQNNLQTSVMTPTEVQDLDLNGRLTILRQTAGTQPALPARSTLQQVAQSSAAAALPTSSSALSAAASNNSSSSNINGMTPSTSTLTIASALVPQHANSPSNSTQHHVADQVVDSSLQFMNASSLPALQQDSSTSVDRSLPYTAPGFHSETNGVTSGPANANSSSSAESTASDRTRATSLSASHSPAQIESIPRTRPTVAAVQARRRRIGDTADQEAPEASSPKRVRKNSGHTLANTSEQDRPSTLSATPASTMSGRPATYPTNVTIVEAHNASTTPPVAQERQRRIRPMKRPRTQQVQSFTYALPTANNRFGGPYFMEILQYTQAGWELGDIVHIERNDDENDRSFGVYLASIGERAAFTSLSYDIVITLLETMQPEEESWALTGRERGVGRDRFSHCGHDGRTSCLSQLQKCSLLTIVWHTYFMASAPIKAKVLGSCFKQHISFNGKLLDVSLMFALISSANTFPLIYLTTTYAVQNTRSQVLTLIYIHQQIQLIVHWTGNPTALSNANLSTLIKHAMVPRLIGYSKRCDLKARGKVLY